MPIFSYLLEGSRPLKKLSIKLPRKNKKKSTAASHTSTHKAKASSEAVPSVKSGKKQPSSSNSTSPVGPAQKLSSKG